jgi:DNA-3-methyladenine glycosylase II
MSYSTHIKLKPVAPYNFELNARIFTGGDPQISGYENGKFWQVINVNNVLILVIVKSTGTVDEPELSITLKSDKKITDEDLKSAENIIISMFNLNFDLKEFYEYMENDAVMSKLIQKLRGLNSRTTPTVFESLVSSIIEQQISLRASQSIERHMIKDYGDELPINDEVYYAFPTPQRLSKLIKEKLRESGLSLRKSEYIIDISKLIVDGKLDLDHLKEYKDINKIIDELSQLRGVGEWTAHLTALRSMHRHRAFPADDLGLRRSISHFYCNDKKITADDARKIAVKWGKWRGLAGFYLIAGEMRDIKI